MKEHKTWSPNPHVVQFDPSKGHTMESTNKFMSASAAQWEVRNKDYLTNDARPKSASKEAAFELVGLTIITSMKPVEHFAQHMQSLKTFLEEDAAGPDPSQFIVCAYLLPGRPSSAAVQLFKRVLPEGEDKAFDAAYSRFVNGDEEYRNNHLKQVASLDNMSWMLRAAIGGLGGLRPVIIGRRLTTKHFTGSNYIEFDMDVASSSVASMLRGAIISSASTLLIDVGWLIEGQEEDELPERLMCAVRWHKLNWDEAVVHLDNKGNQLSNEEAGPRTIVEDDAGVDAGKPDKPDKPDVESEFVDCM